MKTLSNRISDNWIKHRTGGDDGYLYSYEIGLMHLNSHMVVLSACNTGVGKQVEGEGTMSLARSFFMAGAQSVVHTLWPIDDMVSAGIMRSFYKYLAQGCDKATALQRAKLGYLSSATFQSETDPVYWAGFVVSGDGAAVVGNKGQLLYIVIFFSVILLVALLIKRIIK